MNGQGVELPPASPGDLCSHSAAGSKEQTWEKNNKKREEEVYFCRADEWNPLQPSPFVSPFAAFSGMQLTF